MSTEQSVHLQMPITDMHCASCVGRAEKALQKVAGVQQVSVNLASEKADITTDSGIEASVLQQAVVDAGYGVPTEKFELRVTGMHCASCVNHTEKALKKLPGVVSVSVNLAAEKAFIEALSGNVDNAQLIAAVEDAGYEATPLSEDKEDDSERRGKNSAS